MGNLNAAFWAPGTAFIASIIIIVVFLLGRELFCWYWKQTEQVELLKEIRDLLGQPVGLPQEEIIAGKRNVGKEINK